MKYTYCYNSSRLETTTTTTTSASSSRTLSVTHCFKVQRRSSVMDQKQRTLLAPKYKLLVLCQETWSAADSKALVTALFETTTSPFYPLKIMTEGEERKKGERLVCTQRDTGSVSSSNSNLLKNVPLNFKGPS